MLTASDVTKRYGDHLVLDRVSFVINRGDRVGLVGPNGAGKSTLLAIAAGRLRPDAGSVSLLPGLQLGYLRQGFADRPEGTLADLLATAGESVDALLAGQEHVERALTDLADPADANFALAGYDAAQAGFDDAGGYAAIDELATYLARLGLDEVPFETPLGALSGGQKTRAGIAALLFSRPDLLLLDEPTNHLDGDGLAWLEGFLSGYEGAVLCVSHDRAFLDAATTTTFELGDRGGRLTVYPGSYSAYATTKRGEEAAALDAYGRQQREIARIERDIREVAAHARSTERGTQHDFLRARAKKVARTAKVRERRLERLLESEDRLLKPERRWGLAIEFAAEPDSGRDVAVLDSIGVELGGRRILHGVDLHVRHGDRVAVTGPNGAGKSTLVRLLDGALRPTTGTLRLGAGVVVGRYAQEQETVDPDRTVLAQARAVAPLSEADARSFLHRFLFSGDEVLRPAGLLSYGERARLALALLVLRGANFLLLDEPLNHLDLPSRERFEEALASFRGTSLIVLHDRYAIDRLATRVIEVRNGSVREAA